MSRKQTKIERFIELYKEDIDNGNWITKDDMTQKGFFPSTNSNGKDIRFIKSRYEIEEHKEGVRVVKFRVVKANSNNSKRGIRNDILKEIKKQSCAFLGTRSNVEVDHKNGRYNDERVLNLATQTLDDFQPLNKTINNSKREACKKCITTGMRFDARNFGFLLPDLNGEPIHNGKPNGCEGCFYYDVKLFKKRHAEIIEERVYSINK